MQIVSPDFAFASLAMPPASVAALQFRAGGQGALNLGYRSQAVWLRLNLSNRDAFATSALLEIDYPLIDHADLYLADSDGKLALAARSGRLVPVGERPLAHRNPIFSVEIPAQAERRVYLRIVSSDSIVVPLRLHSADGFLRRERRDLYLFGVYYGVIAALAIYNLFLLLTIRDISYLYYSLTLLTLHGFFQLALNGLLGIWAPWLGAWGVREAIPFFLGVGSLAALQFTVTFLDTERSAPWMHRLLQTLSGIAAAVALLSFLIDLHWLIIGAVFFGLLSAIVATLAAIQAMRRGYRPARFYLLGWSMLLAGAFLYGLKALGLLSSTPLTEYAWQFGSALEAILLSMALADRWNELKMERIGLERHALQKEALARQRQDELIVHLQNLDHLKAELLRLDAADGGLELMQDRVLGTLKRVLHFDRGFLVVVDRENRVHIRSDGPFPVEITQKLGQAEFINSLVRAPDALFERLNVILRLQAGDDPFGDLAEAPEWSEAARTARLAIEELRNAGLQLCVPLAYERQIFGYCVLGPRPGGAEYSPGDLLLIETFRYSVALAVRNATLYEEIRALKGKAEQKAHQLTDYLTGMNEIIKHKVREKTLVYASPVMAEAFEAARRYGPQTQPILITGETGTGKELIAQMVHQSGLSPEAPFVAVNCAAIPGELWESEIFGHERGAFTDAKRSYAGRIEQAGKGALFFDEIGEMPLDVQPKLLRILQERKFQRLGGDRTLSAECRFLFATNRNLQEMMQRGLFRDDLYYRISVLEIKLPPLRKRREDIPALAAHMLSRFAAELNSPATVLDSAALEALSNYDWPGNIRELENALIYAAIHAHNEVIGLSELPESIRSGRLIEGGAAPSAHPPWEGRSFEELIELYSRELIQSAIQRAGGNKVEAARLLGIKRATFYYKLKELGLN